MTSRTWADGPAGNTPMTAARMNGIEADLDLRPEPWKPSTAYASGARVISPAGDFITATAAHTSPATFSMTNWQYSGTFVTTASRGAANGVATLDSGGKLPAGQMPAISGLSQKGTYANRPAATGLAGVTYYADDVQEGYRSNGTAWEIVGAGGNNLGATSMATGYSVTSTTYVDVPAMTVTFTAGERPVEIRADVDIAISVGNNNVAVAIVLDGAIISEINNYAPYADKWDTRSRTVIKTGLTPGTVHTAKLQIKAATGIARMDGNATKQSSLTVQGR